MNEDSQVSTDSPMSQPPGWFWGVSVIALLWNVLGMFAFLAQINMSDEAMAALEPAVQELYKTMPPWVTLAFAVAVFGGVIGSIFLLMRKRWATPVLVLSLLGILAQNAYGFFLSDTFKVMGNAAMIGPIVIISIAVLLIPFSRMCDRRGWLVETSAMELRR